MDTLTRHRTFRQFQRTMKNPGLDPGFVFIAELFFSDQRLPLRCWTIMNLSKENSASCIHR